MNKNSTTATTSSSDDELATAVSAFLRALTGAGGKSANTLDSYGRVLHAACEFSRQQKLSRFADWQPFHVRAYVGHRHKAGLSAKSLQLQLSALRAFFRFLVKEGWQADNPAAGIRAPKAGKRLPATLDVDEAQALVDGIAGDDVLAKRDRAIAELFYGSGLRLSELSAVNVADLPRTDSLRADSLHLGSLRSDNYLLRVLGKGSKLREVPVGSKAREAIADWLQVRADLAAADELALFVSQRGSRLSNGQIGQRLAQWGKKLGIRSRVHPHKLRHSCASHFLEGSGDLRAVQELLGHANLSTTQIYTHLDFQHLAKVYDGAHPRAKKKG
ncbi:tyrosine recombinase XerC [Permianibacter fluminis]|uniref:tyrosine recombinase XerC n=1 Tax=Permianibacter fluminis TaxID=2738515 RepID=UPI002E2D39E8|nr:tyrosine recombinase XerC [Permianibacter fluminis]